MERATKRHFFHHGKTGNELEKQDCHWCQLRALITHTTAPITIVNDVDDLVLPSNFRFIDDVVLGEGVEAADTSFRSGCTCEHGENCQFSDCLCLADLDHDEASGDDEEVDGTSLQALQPDSQSGKKAYAYHTHGSKAGLLRSRLHTSKLPLYECHQGCSCTAHCPNRVVERGRTIPLQIFRTNDRGWGKPSDVKPLARCCAKKDAGVRTHEPVKEGQFVDKYLGEVITSAEADRRRAASVVSQRKDVYLFALDKFTDPFSLDARLKGPPLEVDGEFMAGPTRFINHSCEPNLRIFARVGDHADKHIHDLALFAIRDIPKGEELTFDYVDGAHEEELEELNGDRSEHMTKCLCGSAKCRGGLW